MVLPTTSYGAEPSKANEGEFKKRGLSKSEPVYLVVKSRADLNQIFTYYPYPANPGLNASGAGMYRMTVDTQGAVSQIQILKHFKVKGAFIPRFDEIVLQAFSRWRAKPGPVRVVDIPFGFKPAARF